MILLPSPPATIYAFPHGSNTYISCGTITWTAFAVLGAQAHARRLFLASLAYLPVFLACLLIHQRRTASATIEHGVESEGELKGELMVDETLERIKARGRQLCIHEHLVQSDEAAAQHAGSSAARCPVVVGESVVSSAQTLIQPPQKQPQQ